MKASDVVIVAIVNAVEDAMNEHKFNNEVKEAFRKSVVFYLNKRLDEERKKAV